jgi:autotransporter-associated beta strand protein
MKKYPLSLRSLAVFLLAFAVRSASAGVTYTWTGATAGFETDWSTATNWSPSAVPGTGDTAIFGAGGNATPSPAGTSLLHLQFSGTAQPYTIVGSLSMDAEGTITADAGSAVQSLGTVSFPGNGTITNNSANLLTVTALYSGIAGTTLAFGGSGSINEPGNLGAAAGGLVKNGSGTLTLGSNNSSVSGGFSINGGTVIGNNINSFSNKLLTLNGGTMQMNGNGTANYTGAVVNGNAALAANTTINWTFGNGQATSLLTATGTPVLTIRNVGTTGAVLMTLKTSGYDGTW